MNLKEFGPEALFHLLRLRSGKIDCPTIAHPAIGRAEPDLTPNKKAGAQ